MGLFFLALMYIFLVNVVIATYKYHMCLHAFCKLHAIAIYLAMLVLLFLCGSKLDIEPLSSEVTHPLQLQFSPEYKIW